MSLLINKQAIAESQYRISKIVDSINENTIYSTAIELAFGEETIPEDRYTYIKEIERTPIDESEMRGINPEADMNSIPNPVTALQNPEKANKVISDYKRVLQKMVDKQEKAEANDKGWIATIIYYIKKVIKWLTTKVKQGYYFVKDHLPGKEKDQVEMDKFQREWRETGKLMSKVAKMDKD